jgi:hypothetical protein
MFSYTLSTKHDKYIVTLSYTLPSNIILSSSILSYLFYLQRLRLIYLGIIIKYYLNNTHYLHLSFFLPKSQPNTIYLLRFQPLILLTNRISAKEDKPFDQARKEWEIYHRRNGNSILGPILYFLHPINSKQSSAAKTLSACQS